MIILEVFLGRLFAEIPRLPEVSSNSNFDIQVSRRIFQTTTLESKNGNPIIRSNLYPPSLHRSIWKGRNINRLSIGFPRPKARLSLASPNPPVIDIAEETLGFRRRGVSPRLWLLIPTFSPPSAPACLATHLHCCLKCSPTVRKLHKGPENKPLGKWVVGPARVERAVFSLIGRCSTVELLAPQTWWQKDKGDSNSHTPSKGILPLQELISCLLDDCPHLPKELTPL